VVFYVDTFSSLEMTRHEWLTLGNLGTYFDVCAEVLVKAGVAHLNPNYDPNVKGSEPVFINKPHLNASFDETKVALDSTTASKGKQDRGLRAWMEDDGECFMQYLSSCMGPPFSVRHQEQGRPIHGVALCKKRERKS
jgi:hypothetical protein